MTSDDMQKFGKNGMDMAMKSLGAWTSGAQAIAAEITDYSKKSIEGSVAAWEKLLAAKTPEKAMEVQTEFMKSAYADSVAAATKLGELCTGFAKDACKPFGSAAE
jgi:phasin family protein